MCFVVCREDYIVQSLDFLIFTLKHQIILLTMGIHLIQYVEYGIVLLTCYNRTRVLI